VIRRSLTGSAARLVMYQGHDKPIDKILDVLNSVYGTVDNKEQLLAEFYSARQRDDEDVTTWSNRLQDYRDMHSILHAMSWRGLRQELKDISGHKHDMIKDFLSLLPM
jgi:type I site-specific restriction endonuclease